MVTVDEADYVDFVDNEWTLFMKQVLEEFRRKQREYERQKYWRRKQRLMQERMKQQMQAQQNRPQQNTGQSHQQQ